MNLTEVCDRKIDEAATIRVVKKQLEFLSSNSWLLKNNQVVEEEFELLDFLSYTHSIIKVSDDVKSYSSSSAVLKAMERRDQALKQERSMRESMILKMESLLLALSYLPPKERICLSMKYLEQRTIEQICMQMNHASYRTITRLLRLGYLHLAQLLDLEVEVKGETSSS